MMNPALTATEYTDSSLGLTRVLATINDYSADKYPKQKFVLLEAISRLEEMERYWAAHDLVKPSANSLRMTRHFIDSLYLSKEHANFIEPDGDGAIILQWISKEKNKRIILTIDGLNLHLSAEENGNEPEFVDEISFFDYSDQIPDIILKFIPDRA